LDRHCRRDGRDLGVGAVAIALTFRPPSRQFAVALAGADQCGVGDE